MLYITLLLYILPKSFKEEMEKAKSSTSLVPTKVLESIRSLKDEGNRYYLDGCKKSNSSALKTAVSKQQTVFNIVADYQIIMIKPTFCCSARSMLKGLKVCLI